MARSMGILGGLFLAATMFSTLSAAAAISESACSCTITKDVVILGGGASGAYNAVRLREDFGKSIVLVEKKDHIGGHVDTYIDPVTGNPFDFGVQAFNDYGPARAFFARMNVTTASLPRVPLTSKYVDFSTGTPVNFTAPAAADRALALQNFYTQALLYENLLQPGYFNFPAPSSIPSDLLLPFGEFVAKYNLQAAVNQVFEVTGLGVGDMPSALTMYVMQAFDAEMLRAFLGLSTAFVPASHRNIEIYETVAKLLGDDVLTSSTVVQSQRTATGVTLWVKGQDAKYTLIKARKLLIAFEPTMENMAPFDMDSQESGVFSKFVHSNVYAGIVSHPSLPVNVSLVNIPSSAVSSTTGTTNYLALPTTPFNARFDYMGTPSNLWSVLMVGDENFSSCAAQKLVRRNFRSMVAAGTLPAPPKGTSDKLVFKAWADHGAMHMRVSADDLKAGFVQQQYALQGHRSTWYTGAAWSVQFQAVLWAFDDVLLPKMIAAQTMMEQKTALSYKEYDMSSFTPPLNRPWHGNLQGHGDWEYWDHHFKCKAYGMNMWEKIDPDADNKPPFLPRPTRIWPGPAHDSDEQSTPSGLAPATSTQKLADLVYLSRLTDNGWRQLKWDMKRVAYTEMRYNCERRYINELKEWVLSSLNSHVAKFCCDPEQGLDQWYKKLRDLRGSG
ncbi:hypothetical protein QBC46DRAFT_359403 [Diplogelasinospora grovesii]|uniref:Amine oxidase domain-containing protein n=1 Tax=Diplogelasinospora grovesii TaxID=303347 RepID=A0AAN6RYH3_9PEZI|nr:hypothetical protein QBC46DRAFT_359403 [Diplogelasinospora grovesii]